MHNAQSKYHIYHTIDTLLIKLVLDRCLVYVIENDGTQLFYLPFYLKKKNLNLVSFSLKKCHKNSSFLCKDFNENVNNMAILAEMHNFIMETKLLQPHSKIAPLDPSVLCCLPYLPDLGQTWTLVCLRFSFHMGLFYLSSYGRAAKVFG